MELPYWHAMDKQAAYNLRINPANLGTTTPPFKNQLEGMQARIRQGATHIELGFLGSGKAQASSGSTTPGMYGKEEREAMKQLAKINNVTLSTHAGANVIGFAGQGQRGFSEEQREQNLKEVKRAIEFAGDVSEGGPVVAHLGEFPRNISENFGKEGFQAYPEEDEKGIVYLMDKQTGEIIDHIKKDQKVFVPVVEKNKDGSIKIGSDGKPIFVKEEGSEEIKIEPRTYADYVKEAEIYNKNNPDNKKTPAQLLFKENNEVRKLYNEAYSKHHYDRVKELREKYEELEKKKEFYKKIEQSIDESSKEELKNKFSKEIYGNELSFAEKKLPSEFFAEKADDVYKAMIHDRDMAVSLMQQAKEIDHKIEQGVPMEVYAVEKTADTFGRLGIEAMQTTIKKDLKKPIFVSPENAWSPELGYGAHPEELKTVIIKSRDRMVDLLTKPKIDGKKNNFFRPGMSKSKARDLANEHIKATFDIGHANTWRKFWTKKPQEFKKWMGEQVSDLTKNKIIGHVHITDNFGYADEHLTPGEGNAPIKEFINHMRKSGYKEPIVVEPGSQDIKSMHGAWSYLQAPVLGKESWTDIENVYIGKTYAPQHVIGEYAPQSPHQAWTFWSETPLE